jgi:hypothetical protein
MTNNFNPRKSIQSRYSSIKINNNYSTTNISPVIGNKRISDSGYIFAPYILMESINIEQFSRKIVRENLRKKRLEKLYKLKSII